MTRLVELTSCDEIPVLVNGDQITTVRDHGTYRSIYFSGSHITVTDTLWSIRNDLAADDGR